MNRKIIGIILTVCMVIVALAGCNTVTKAPSIADSSAASSAATVDGAAETLAVDLSKILASDGQPLLVIGDKKDVPERPANPDALPETDPLHWWDMEYAGWKTVKAEMPVSPKDGAKGKKVILIVHGDHPWTTAYINGAKKAAEAYGIVLKTMSPNWDLNVQNQMIDQAINEKPDAIALIPIDAKAAVQQFKKIYDAKIPLVSTNTLSVDEAMKYTIGWSGPDDWGQFRMLTNEFAKKMNFEGGYACISHSPGGSPFFARTDGPISELAKVAPKMKLLDRQAPGFDAAKVTQLVSDWITKYGTELKGIIAADDSAQLIGIIDALKKAKRTDIVVVAAGNSKAGMDAVKAGDCFAITYQTTEGDGAAAMRTAALFFAGAAIEPVTYLPKHIITKDDVDSYMPAQW
ncbi:MAG: sugar ABC transporter substrate-binding protein [Saccharofermentanales bacterium]